MNKNNPNVKAFKKWYRRVNGKSDFDSEWNTRGFDDPDVDRAWQAYMAGRRSCRQSSAKLPGEPHEAG